MSLIRLWQTLFVPVFLGFCFLGVYLYFHLGANQTVNVTLANYGPQVLIFRNHLGPYHKINSVIEAVENWARANNVPCLETFGRYLDDPTTVAEDRLRSQGGCLVNQALAKLPEGFAQESLPAGQYVKAEFRGSPAIGPWRVYPRLKEFIETQRLSTQPITIEIYKIENQNKMTTTYLVPTESAPSH